LIDAEDHSMAELTQAAIGRIRTDVVGSLLRPARLKQAYAEREQKKLSDDDVRRIGECLEDDVAWCIVHAGENQFADAVTVTLNAPGAFEISGGPTETVASLAGNGDVRPPV